MRDSWQANTTISGESCADWSLFTPRSELLILNAGLYKNLCRNPDWDNNGPWCFNSQGQKKYCNIPKCGGAASRVTSVVATFEDLAADSQEIDHVFARNTWGTMGSVDTSTAYCGSSSWYFPKSAGALNKEWIRDSSSGKTVPDGNLYSTAEFPWLCMAYKIPPQSHVILGMWLHENGRHVWKRFQMNAVLPLANRMLARFDIIAGMFMKCVYAYMCAC